MRLKTKLKVYLHSNASSLRCSNYRDTIMCMWRA